MIKDIQEYYGFEYSYNGKELHHERFRINERIKMRMDVEIDKAYYPYNNE